MAVAALLTTIPIGCMLTATFTFLAGRAEEPFILSTPFEDVGSLSVQWRNGSIFVLIDETATEISVFGTKLVESATEDRAEDGLEEVEITLETAESSPTQVLLSFSAPEDGTALHSADVNIVIPGGITLIISSESGNINVRGNTEATLVTVVNGKVEVSDQAGDVSVNTTNGDIEISSTARIVEAIAQNGSVSVTAQPGSDGSIIARTTAGNEVAILVPADTAATLRLSTNLGIVDFSLEAFTVDDLQVEFDEVTATLNGGGGSIIGEASFGSVTFGSL